MYECTNSNLSSSGDDDNVGDVGGQLGEEGDLDGLPDPGANVPDEGGILATGQTHTTFT